MIQVICPKILYYIITMFVNESIMKVMIMLYSILLFLNSRFSYWTHFSFIKKNSTVPSNFDFCKSPSIKEKTRILSLLEGEKKWKRRKVELDRLSLTVAIWGRWGNRTTVSFSHLWINTTNKQTTEEHEAERSVQHRATSIIHKPTETSPQQSPAAQIESNMNY